VKLSEVRYLTECPIKLYNQQINEANSLHDLLEVLESWEGLADDALAKARTFNDVSFKLFRKHLHEERKRKFNDVHLQSGVLEILMPELMFRASVAEQEYKAPWGTCVIRLSQLTPSRGAEE
jgi:hypothetical protein